MPATKPTSEAAICNLALDLLKAKPITSIDNPSNSTAETCARHYHQKRLATLRKHPWNFATKRAAIPETVVDIPFGFESAYALPSDFVRLCGIGEEGSFSYTNDDEELLIRYVYDMKNTSKFDPLFVEIFYHELALGMAASFSASTETIEHIKSEIKRKAPEGYAVDGQERPPIRITRSRWIQRRRGGRGSNAGYGSPYTDFGGDNPPVKYQVEDGYILIGVPS